MQIRTKITYRFTIIVGLILILFSTAIYYFSDSYRKREFYSRLKDKAITTAKLLSKDVTEIDPSILKVIEKNSASNLPQERISVYDLQNNLVYNSTDDNGHTTSSDRMENIKRKKEVKYLEGKTEVIGILFEGPHDRFIVIASAFDKYGFSKLKFLKYILLIGVLTTIGITVITGQFFSKQALQPIANVVNQVDKITIASLNSRVSEGNGTDEIAKLGMTFNKMLERLEAAFKMQRSFVANASHELRTPLTVITGQIEVSLMDKNINEDGKQVLRSLLDDIRNLNKLSNGLLDLAQTSFDISEIRLTDIRIDELIGQARAEILKRNKDYKIEIHMSEFPEDENKLILNGSEPLMRVAIINIIENACKYSSDKTAQLSVAWNNDEIVIVVNDNGIGIPEFDFQNIFEPFFRSNNAKVFSGHGIGLTLTQKILSLHKGQIHINSKVNEGTNVSISLPYKK